MTISIYTEKKPRKKRSDAKSINKRRESYFTRVKIKHSGYYLYPYPENYETKDSIIRVKCPIHGIFKILASNHLYQGSGCSKCFYERQTNEQLKSQEQFEKEARIIYSNTKEYGKYNGALVEMDIKCNTHNIWYKQVANNLLRGYEGCPHCSKNTYSKIAIKWIESFNNPNIQHALNGGEYRIPNTRYLVDGYDSTTNTVYEFHGDVWHGNPNLFEYHVHCHPFNKDITAKELHNKTIEREEVIKYLGYNLIVMWENDYKSTLIIK